MPSEPSPAPGHDAELQETLATLEQIQQITENLLVRGLGSAGSQELKTLSALETELSRIGAGHLAGRIGELRRRLQDDPPTAVLILLGTQASLRVFERVLTLEWAAAALAGLDTSGGGGECN
jgi:hypothetical protein